MVVIFLIGTLLIALGFVFNKKTIVNNALIVVYLVLLFSLGIYEFKSINITQFDFFTPDSLGILMLAAICIVAVPAFFYGYRYVKSHEEKPGTRGIFFAAMAILISACAMSYLANHIAVTWIFVELTTLSASALIYHHRNIRALEGAWKYVFICAISITFVYVGILFLSLALKQAGVEDMSFASLYSHCTELNPFWLKLAFLFIFTGFTAKLGIVPMYTAGIDAKDKAPAPAGALLASVLMNLGFVAIYRVYAVVAHTPLKHWANVVILVAALLSVFFAAVYMTRIKNIKRMFAYSGVEHMGLVMLGLAAGGIGVYAAILHVILHTFIKPTLFFQFNQIYSVYQSKSIYDVGNYFKYNKSGAMLVLLAFISATAMPPSGLFVSELLIFQSLFQSNYLIVLLVVLILLTLIIWGFGSNTFKLLFIPPVSTDQIKPSKISPWESLPQYVLLAVSVYLAYNPPAMLVTLIENAVKLVQ